MPDPAFSSLLQLNQTAAILATSVVRLQAAQAISEDVFAEVVDRCWASIQSLSSGRRPLGLYADALRSTEQSHVAFIGNHAAADAVEQANSRRDLQRAQLAHDGQYATNVNGGTALSTLNYCVLDLNAALGTISAALEQSVTVPNRVIADLLHCTLRIASAAGIILESNPIEHYLS
jgi:hypothetical protein